MSEEYGVQTDVTYVLSNLRVETTQKYETLAQRWLTVVPASLTVDQQ